VVNNLPLFFLRLNDVITLMPIASRRNRFDPAGSSQYLHFLGFAHLMLGNYETAAAHFRERVRLSPQTDLSRALLASALGHLGRLEEARQIWRELMNINPAYSFTAHMNRQPFVNPAEPNKIAAGLAKAGLPN